MTSAVAEIGTCVIALAGILVVVGARKIGWRVLAVGVILVVASAVLSPNRQANIGNAHVASR